MRNHDSLIDPRRGTSSPPKNHQKGRRSRGGRSRRPPPQRCRPGCTHRVNRRRRRRRGRKTSGRGAQRGWEQVGRWGPTAATGCRPGPGRHHVAGLRGAFRILAGGWRGRGGDPPAPVDTHPHRELRAGYREPPSAMSVPRSSPPPPPALPTIQYRILQRRPPPTANPTTNPTASRTANATASRLASHRNNLYILARITA